MYSLQDANIHNLAVKGVFDDCQDMVKQVNADAAFKAQHRIGAVNSINWARVAAQVVYYFKGYFAATRDDREQVSFAVPSGNFGNIYAGYVARAHGPADPPADPRHQRERRARRVLPHRALPGAAQGEARPPARRWTSPRRPTSSATCSTWSAATRRASRTCGGGSTRTASSTCRTPPYWPRVAQSGFVSGKSTHADRLATIRNVFSKYGVMIDPHTADGVKVGLEHREAGVPLICLETALPAKFADTLREALGREPRAAGGVPGPRAPAAALQADRARCRGREALYCVALMAEKERPRRRAAARAATTRSPATSATAAAPPTTRTASRTWCACR